MVGKLLVRGMLAGIVAGLLTFSFAKVAGEPQVDQAISFEQKADAAKGEAPEPELVSRHTQAGLGLLTGVMAFSAAIGGLFALTLCGHVWPGRQAQRECLVGVACHRGIHCFGDCAEPQISGQSAVGW